MITIAYPGLEGSFSYLAAKQLFGTQHKYAGYKTFEQAGEAVQKGAVDYALLPLENSLAGSVYANYDCLSLYQLRINAEIYLRIEACLLGIKENSEESEVKLETLKQVWSHPKALEQCKQFFERHPWIEGVADQNTAMAAARIKRLKDPSIGAIASFEAAELYQLTVLQRNVEDHPRNYTRFVCVGREASEQIQANKCSLMIHLSHRPKALYNVLGLLAQEGYNLTKIESRPLEGQPFEYVFYIDFEFDFLQKKNIQVVLKKIQENTEKFKLLGLYQAGSHE